MGTICTVGKKQHRTNDCERIEEGTIFVAAVLWKASAHIQVLAAVHGGVRLSFELEMVTC